MKVAFTCVENSCRSQIAEAMAKKMFPEQGIEFVSAGTHPAGKVDVGAIEILKEEKIHLTGKPKAFTEIGNPDIVVTMGCDVECPAVPGAKIESWDIPDPKGKEMIAYRNVLEVIKNNLIQLMNRITNKKQEYTSGKINI